jgi:dinuclear metal center YbgI/SA1388 family protein
MPAQKIGDIIKALEARAPAATAEDWDNVGLLIGDPSDESTGAVVSIDLTQEAIELAEKKKYRLIVNHHPCIFPKSRGLARVTKGHLAFEAARRGISVYSSHTNFDRCALEVVRTVSHGLGVTPRGRLQDAPRGELAKLVVFVPKTHLDKVRDAVCDAGAGHIGRYDLCSFGTAGMGTFRGDESSKPLVGKPGKLETAEEIRFETVFPKGLEKQVVEAMRASHPYEEVAYDVYALEQAASFQAITRGLGYGFWGEFSKPRPFPEVAESVTSLFNLDGFWLSNPAPSHVKRIAFVAGMGASFLDAASSSGVDLFITGETVYHRSLGASRKGMAVMEVGHRESERFFVTTMEGWLADIGIAAIGAGAATQKLWTGGKK